MIAHCGICDAHYTDPCNAKVHLLHNRVEELEHRIATMEARPDWMAYAPRRPTKPLPPCPTFEEAWRKKEAEGYQYDRDALEGVRFGWELRASYGAPRRVTSG